MIEMSYYDWKLFEKWARGMEFSVADLLMLEIPKLDEMAKYWKDNIKDYDTKLCLNNQQARMKFMKG